MTDGSYVWFKKFFSTDEGMCQALAFREQDDSFMAASFKRTSTFQRYSIMVLSAQDGSSIYEYLSNSDFV